ncbi:unnamed protein product, partial [Colletotrichum noveboracense]
MTEPHEPTRKLRGNCHCTAVVYVVYFPEPRKATQCGCDLCVKKANLWLSASRSEVTFVKGDESSLTSYTIGAEDTTYKFCGVCATSVMAISSSDTQIAFNARTFQALDVKDLKLEEVDYVGHSSSQQRSILKTAETSPPLNSPNIYTGGCHCGALTLRLRSTPLDRTYEGLVLECNCRVCEMNGYVWVYPNDENVDLIGDEKDIGRYKFSHNILWNHFAKLVESSSQTTTTSCRRKSMMTCLKMQSFGMKSPRGGRQLMLEFWKTSTLNSFTRCLSSLMGRTSIRPHILIRDID